MIEIFQKTVPFFFFASSIYVSALERKEAGYASNI